VPAEEIARAHQRERAALAAAAEQAAAEMWADVDPDAISASWAERVPAVTATTTAAQQAAAGAADAYVAEVLAAQGIDPTPDGRVNPRSLAGIASDGRALASLLAQPGITALTAIGAGATVEQAMATGLASARMIVATQVADAGRAADGVALTTRPAASGYVRVVVGRTCSRCTILAGKFYRWNQGFDRHPKCDCIHLPSVQAKAAGLVQNPRKLFDGLSRAEQDRVYTRAGAQAIRDGADMGQVVNARKGMYTAGGQKLTRAGGRQRPRLMPEEIYRQAGGDREKAIALLRQHGYISGSPSRVIRDRPEPTLADRVAAGVKDRQRLGGGVMADTELVTLADGTRAVFKRAKDSSGIPAIDQQDAEELGALVARAVGLRAPVVYRASVTEVYMSHLPGTIADEFDDATLAALRASDEGRRLGLADLLMGNTDRNGGNLLIDGDRIGAIDHGSAFQWHHEYNPPGRPPQFRDTWWSDYGSSSTGTWRTNPLSPADIDLLRRRLGELEAEFARLHRQDWFAAMMARLDALEQHAGGTGRLVT
jgi:hypothetical protein